MVPPWYCHTGTIIERTSEARKKEKCHTNNKKLIRYDSHDDVMKISD